MKKTSAIWTLILLFTTTIFTQTPTETPPPLEDEVVKITTNLIQIDVTVTDDDGKVITDLKPEDFEIYENGKKQEITNFSFISADSEEAEEEKSSRSKRSNETVVPLPTTTIRKEQVRRTIALVVDDLTLSFESVHFVRRALRKFVNNQMQEGDLVAIIRTGSGIGALQQFTNDKRILNAAIDRIQWNPRGSGGISAFDPVSAALGDLDETNENDVDSAKFNSEADVEDFRNNILATGTLGAINYVIRGMQDLPGRKSVMLLSDGFRLFSRGDGERSSNSNRILNSVRKVIDQANRASVVIYTMDARGLQTTGFTAADDLGSRPIGPPGGDTRAITLDKLTPILTGRSNELFDSQGSLVYLARETGGFAIINDNDLSGGIRRALNDQSYYLIGYQPDEETFDPETRRFNELNINVKRKNAKVRYRSGFFGISDEQIEKAPTNLTAEQRILRALSSPFGDNEISLSLNTVFRADPDYNPSISSFLYIDLKDLKFTDEPNGNKKGAFDLLAVSFGDNGIPIDQISKTYTLNIKKEFYEKLLKEGFIYYFVLPIEKHGAYQMRVAIRDHQTNKVGSASQFIEVPKLKKKRLTLSGLILENLTREQWNAETGQNTASIINVSTNPRADTALRAFKRGNILRYGFEIYNAKSQNGQKPDLQMYSRLFYSGKMIHEGKKQPIKLNGQSSTKVVQAAGAIALGTEMPLGDYILQIVVLDNAAKGKSKIATQFVQFEITE